MTEALYRRLDDMEAFAADVAHEIKNPLTSLRSAIEVLENIDDVEKRKKLMAIVREDVGRIERPDPLLDDDRSADEPRGERVPVGGPVHERWSREHPRPSLLGALYDRLE